MGKQLATPEKNPNLKSEQPTEVFPVRIVAPNDEIVRLILTAKMKISSRLLHISRNLLAQRLH